MSLTLGIDRPSFLVDSKQRLAGSIENFTYRIDIDDKGDESYDQVAVVSVTIPKTYYSLSTDSILRVIENSVPRDIVVPKGDYNTNSLQHVLLAKLNIAPATITYTMTYPDPITEANTKKFTWTHDQAYAVSFETIGDNRLHHILGFYENIAYSFADVSGTQTLVSYRAVNMEHTKYILLKSDISHNTGNLDSDTEILCRIPVMSGDSPIHYRLINLEDEVKTLAAPNNNQFRFCLYDDEGRLLDLNENDWSFTMFLSKYNYHDEVNIKHIKLTQIEKLNM